MKLNIEFGTARIFSTPIIVTRQELYAHPMGLLDGMIDDWRRAALEGRVYGDLWIEGSRFPDDWGGWRDEIEKGKK